MALLLVLLATAADAQVTTDCYRNGISTRCTTNPGITRSPGVTNYYDLFRQPLDRQNYINALEEQNANEREALRLQRETNRPTVAETESQLLHKRVGELIANGDCPTAEQLALRGGDLALARQTKDYCASLHPAP